MWWRGYEQEEIRKCIDQRRQGLLWRGMIGPGRKGALSDKRKKGVDGRWNNEDGKEEARSVGAAAFDIQNMSSSQPHNHMLLATAGV